MIPYGRQWIEDDDVASVAAVLRGDWLTQGPNVEAFERAFADKTGARYAVAVNSGTAALHAAMHALGIGPGDEVIVPPITFTATANCVVFQGATPVFADVRPSGHLDPERVEQRVTKRTKAVIAVDYAGWPCDYASLLAVCDRNRLPLVCDACHALGASWNGRPAGSIGRLNCFSFHPVKHIATGEGGMITTDDAQLAARMRDFRTHGITKEAPRFLGLGAGSEERGPWYYEMQNLGFNYRISDINCALGASQLKKLDRFVARRREIAARYYRELGDLPHTILPPSDLQPKSPSLHEAVRHAFHLFPLRVNFEALGKTRTAVMSELRARGVGTQVHYIPVNLQPFYRERFQTRPGQCPEAERFYAGELSIPMFAAMTEDDVSRVSAALRDVLQPA